MSFSQNSEICKKCKYYADCDDKRMAACAEIEFTMLTQSQIDSSVSMSAAQPLLKRESGVFLTEQITKEIERQYTCDFNLMFGA